MVGSLGDVQVKLVGDVFGISWGPTFAGWVVVTKIGEVENKISGHANYITTQKCNYRIFCCKIKTS